MLPLEDLGRKADVRVIRDPRVDEAVHAQVNLLIHSAFGCDQCAGPSRHCRHVVAAEALHGLQAPVSTDKLKSCARARQAGVDHSAVGHPSGTLQMGIVPHVANVLQKFSMDVAGSVRYDPALCLI